MTGHYRHPAVAVALLVALSRPRGGERRLPGFPPP